jgi:hypothetical protein
MSIRLNYAPHPQKEDVPSADLVVGDTTPLFIA